MVVIEFKEEHMLHDDSGRKIIQAFLDLWEG